MPYGHSNPEFITIGRGALYFAPFVPGTHTPKGFRFLGNAPAFSLTINVNKLEHFSSTEQIKQKDKIVVLDTTRSGAITLDEIHPDNVAMFLFGQNDPITETAATGITESITGVELDRSYMIGVSDTYPSGRKNITNLQVAKSGTALVENTDYKADLSSAMIHILATATGVSAGDTIDLTYDQVAFTRNHIKAGSDLIEGALKFVSNNPTGAQQDVFCPYVSMNPTGDMQLIGDDWMQIPLEFEALVDGDKAAVYVDGKPVA